MNWFGISGNAVPPGAEWPWDSDSACATNNLNECNWFESKWWRMWKIAARIFFEENGQKSTENDILMLNSPKININSPKCKSNIVLLISVTIESFTGLSSKILPDKKEKCGKSIKILAYWWKFTANLRNTLHQENCLTIMWLYKRSIPTLSKQSILVTYINQNWLYWFNWNVYDNWIGVQIWIFNEKIELQSIHERMIYSNAGRRSAP